MKNKAGDQSIVRIANQKTIIEYLRNNGPTSKADLSRILEISKPTVAKNVENLMSDNILYEFGEGESSGGRKPMLISFNPRYKYVLSLNINTDYPMIALFDLDGKIIKKSKVTVDKKIKENDFFEKIYLNIDNMMKNQEIDDEKIGVISVSTPGIINESTGEIDANPQFKEWEAINISKELNTRFGKKIIVKNDISMAALGEKYYGIAKKFDDLIYIASTLGVGAGLILNGKLYEGKRKAAGEIGYFIQNPNVDNDSNLENLYSIPNIIKKITKEIDENKSSLIYELSNNGEKEITLSMIIECINSADKYILKVLDQVALAYGVAINNISILLDLECVVIGGALAELGIQFVHRIGEIVKNNNPIDVEILPTGLKENATLYGAYIIGNQYLTKNMIK